MGAKVKWRRANTITGDCRYHLKDVIVGKIYFLLVRIKIKHMELSIIRRETTGAGEGSVAPSSGLMESPAHPVLSLFCSPCSTKSVQRVGNDYKV